MLNSTKEERLKQIIFLCVITKKKLLYTIYAHNSLRTVRAAVLSQRNTGKDRCRHNIDRKAEGKELQHTSKKKNETNHQKHH